MSWIPGRRGTNYFKKKILEFKRFDIWILKYPPGSKLPIHHDHCDHGDIWRFNLTLKGCEAGGTYHLPRGLRLGPLRIFNASKDEHGMGYVWEGTKYVLSIGIVL